MQQSNIRDTDFMECHECDHIAVIAEFDGEKYVCPKCNSREVFWVMRKDVPDGVLLVDEGELVSGQVSRHNGRILT